MTTTHIVSFVLFINLPYFDATTRNVFPIGGSYPEITLPTSTNISDYILNTTTLNTPATGIYPGWTTVTINLPWTPPNNDTTLLQNIPFPKLSVIQTFSAASSVVGSLTAGTGGWTILQIWVDGESVYYPTYNIFYNIV